MWTGIIRHRMQAIGGLFEYTVTNHWLLEMREASPLAKGLLAFQEGLRFLKLVI